MPTNPCISCDRFAKSKNVPRCRDCGRRSDYLNALEQGCECRGDPVYNSAYSLPRVIVRQIGHVQPFSQMDLILYL